MRRTSARDRALSPVAHSARTGLHVVDDAGDRKPPLTDNPETRLVMFEQERQQDAEVGVLAAGDGRGRGTRHLYGGQPHQLREARDDLLGIQAESMQGVLQRLDSRAGIRGGRVLRGGTQPLLHELAQPVPLAAAPLAPLDDLVPEALERLKAVGQQRPRVTKALPSPREQPPIPQGAGDRIGEIRRLGPGLSHVELSAEEGGAPHQRDADELPLIVSGGACRLGSVETQREAVLFKKPAHREAIVTRGARSPQDRTTPRIVL